MAGLFILYLNTNFLKLRRELMPMEIRPIEHKWYPLEEAIQKAAEQNARRDYRLGLISSDDFCDLTAVKRKEYTSEAARMLTEFGVNYVPNAPEIERIHVAPEVFLPEDEAVEKVAYYQVKIAVQAGLMETPSSFGNLPTATIEKFLVTARQALKNGNGRFFAQGYSHEVIIVKK
jgi:hypothetical protein